MKKILILCLLVFSSFSVVACGSETKSEPDAVPMKPATAVFETSMGDFEVKLATDLAPKTCENFINLLVLVQADLDIPLKMNSAVN